MNLDLPAAVSTPVDWERQRAFLAVIDTGSLSAAARQLGAAQPTVRRRIEDLEAQLGVALFTRSPSGLTPTALARDLAQHARAMAIAAASLARAAGALSPRPPRGPTPAALARALAHPAGAMAIPPASLARAASAEAEAASGVVRITASEVIGMEVLPAILAALRETHPGLVFEL